MNKSQLKQLVQEIIREIEFGDDDPKSFGGGMLRAGQKNPSNKPKQPVNVPPFAITTQGGGIYRIEDMKTHKVVASSITWKGIKEKWEKVTGQRWPESGDIDLDENHYAMQRPEEFEKPEPNTYPNSDQTSKDANNGIPVSTKVEKSKGLMINGKEVDLASLEVEDVDVADYPDFSDAFLSAGSFKDGTDMTDEEMQAFQDEYPDIVHELAHESLHESVKNEAQRIVNEIHGR